ncbi:MAG: 4Fe-4S binding protein [Deltaproteobacteria bacterium]|nr:4Fe-4S binding protein [Deltaproteobacteria bacterium]
MIAVASVHVPRANVRSGRIDLDRGLMAFLLWIYTYMRARASAGRISFRVLATGCVFAAVGAFTLVCQTLFFREYLTGFRGNEFSVSFFFSSWMVWIALGALLATAMRRRLKLERFFIPIILFFPAVAAAQGLLLIALRSLTKVEPFELFPLGKLLYFTLLVNAPTSFLSGISFTAGCLYLAQQRNDEGDSAERIATGAYAFEALGSFIGGSAVTFLMWRFIPLISLFLMGSALLLAAVFILSCLQGGKKSALISLTLLIGVSVVNFTPLSGELSGFLARLRWRSTMPEARLLASYDTPYQQVDIAEYRHQRIFVANGHVVATDADAEWRRAQAALLAAQRPNAREIAVIGFGSEGLVPHLLRYGAHKIDLIAVDKRYHELVLPYYDKGVRQAFRDRRVKLFFGDARGLAAHKAGGAYDLIVVDLPEPETAALNRFYTVEFYRAVKKVLSSRGVLATRLSSGENYAGEEVLQYGRSVFHSLDRVFAEVMVTPGERSWFFASPSKGVVSLDPSVLAARFRQLASRDDSVPPEIFHSLIAAERVASTQKSYRQFGRLMKRPVLNSDDKPISFFLSLLVSAKRSGFSIGRLLEVVEQLGLKVFLLPLGVFVLLRLYYRAKYQTRERALAFNGAWLVTSYGAVSISLCILLLLAFQSRFGHLFISIGLLSALFMLGLFLGGMGGRWALRKRDRRPALWPVYIVLALSGGLCLVLPPVISWLAHSPRGFTLCAYHFLCLLAGIFSGLAFPAGGYYLGQKTREVGFMAGLLESMDHWGAAVGAALCGVFIIPVLGTTRTFGFLFCCLVAVGLLFFAEQPLVSGVVEAAKQNALLKRWGARQRPNQKRPIAAASVLIALGTIVCAGLISNIVVARLSAPRVDFDPNWIKARFPTARVMQKEKPFIHYRILSARGESSSNTDRTEGEPRELVFASQAIAPRIEGYGGPMNFLVSVGSEERVREVALIESNETPAYIYDIRGWLKQFEDWPLDKPIKLEDNVDVLAGATITSRAAARILEACRVTAAKRLFHRSVQLSDEIAWPRAMAAEATGLLAAFILAIALFLRGNQAQRTLFLCANVLVFGLIYNLQFSFAHVLRLATFDLPSFETGEPFFMTAGVLLLALAFGQLYCGYLCPFGALQELIGRLGFMRKPNREGGRLRALKYWILAFSLLLFFLSRSEKVSAFDPLQTAFRLSYTGWTLALLAIIAGFSLVYFRFFCRYLCPAGAFLALFNRIGLALRFARPKAYSDCDLGVRSRSQLDCIQCNRCIEKRAARAALGLGRNEFAALSGEMMQYDETRSATNWFRDRWNLLLMLGVFSCVAVGAGLAFSRPSVEQVEVLGHARQLDAVEIRKQIQENRLSDHEALFYRRPSQNTK